MQRRLKVGFETHRWFLATYLYTVMLLLSGSYVAQAAPSATLPVPKVLRPNVAFWKHIFTKVDSHSGVLHDAADVTIVYHTFQKLPRHPRQRQRLIDHSRRHYKRILLKLAQGKRRRLNRDEKRTLALFKGKQTRRTFRAAAHNIRFQQGLRDRFARGLAHSGAYMPFIRKIFVAAGLPTELGFLPHVESSFNNQAYSKFGAAGMWQFTRSTGRRFLRIDRAIDERFDYQLATEAAAKLLQENFQELGTWPLAITAYNHGVHGMKRAIAKLGTRDFGTIVQRYRSRTFGFASKNFYAEFLAAMDIATHYHTYFQDITFDRPRAYHALKLDAYMNIHTLAKYLRVGHQEIARWNPALRRSVLRGQRFIPKGVVLNIPHHRLSPAEAQARWASIPVAVKFSRQLHGGKYRVRRGDTLSTIARRLRTSVDVLMDLNDIDRPDVIRLGQLLRLPRQSRRRVASRQPAPKTTIKFAAPALSPDPPAFAHNPVAPSKGNSHLASNLLMAGLPLSELRAPDTEAWLRVKNGTIRVVATETLGLYATWLEVSIRRLRTLNRLSRRRLLSLGTKLRLDFSKVSEAEFTKRRQQYHRRIEKNFFRAYAVHGVITHTLRRGETLWMLAHREYDIPFWLLQKYNDDLEFGMLSPGTKLRIPQVVEKAS